MRLQFTATDLARVFTRVVREAHQRARYSAVLVSEGSVDKSRDYGRVSTTGDSARNRQAIGAVEGRVVVAVALERETSTADGRDRWVKACLLTLEAHLRNKYEANGPGYCNDIRQPHPACSHRRHRGQEARKEQLDDEKKDPQHLDCKFAVRTALRESVIT